MKQCFKGDVTCQGVYKSGTKRGQTCDKPAYYIAGDQYFCGIHSKGLDRQELKANPRKTEIATEKNEEREAAVIAAMSQNMSAGRRGEVIVTKLKAMKLPEHRSGYMSVFPNNKHGNRTDGFGMSSLSPMRMGPIKHYIPDAPIANTLEDFWQSSKAYNSEVDRGGEPTDEYYRTRNAGFRNATPQRHKQVGDPKSGVAFSVWYDESGEAHKLPYVESRQVYCAIYEYFASRTEDLETLVMCHAEGMNLNIIGYDGNDVSRYKGSSLEAKFEAAYLDDSVPFGHEMCLQAMLLLEPKRRPWAKYQTIKVHKITK